jgi:SAM-dependent methyltransferase
MENKYLTSAEVLAGYDAVCKLYPYIPSMSIWRAWEYAAYQHFKLAEPILDIGCGDGSFFHLVWPNLVNAIGVDMDTDVTTIARRSGIYREVINSSAFKISFPSKSFDSVFANCSLEHMDRLSDVLGKIYGCLRPGGMFAFSVVNEKLVEWSPLPLLIASACDSDYARIIQTKYENYHHLVNPLPVDKWISYMEKAKFQIIEHIPILPEMTSRLFLFIDQVWHLPKKGGELGDTIYPFLKNLHKFPEGLKDILSGIMQMEKDWSIGCGAVFLSTRL